jgi:methyl-accepting chemotaxis protein
MQSLADELVQESEESVQRVIAQSEQTANQSIRVFLSVGFLALLVSIGMGASLNRIIANPLKDISGAAEKIASGDLSVVLSSKHRKDEVGALAQAFSGMIESLQEKSAVAGEISAGNLKVQVTPRSEKDVLGNAFASMVKNLREVTTEIREGMNVLASSASEILASTTQVASGAAETATAVSQTTSTVEEVKQTAQVSSQKAKHVSESAQKSGQVSQTGRKAVDDTITAMNRIREQVDSIAESIVRLSEQSQAIGEIIATVNGLAEQSNLLAVNASIEAAKAGEQGKGFAVVAQEVRSLAEQSKQATAQVRAILGDIQKATSAAVMATEQGSKAVEAGVAQSSETGESIRVLADSIAEASQAATQIAASAQQQLVGMDQVALAMENIKQASAQNVASTRQAETAAQNLHELGQKLKQLVEQYQV